MKNKNIAFSLVATMLMLASTGAILGAANQPTTMTLTYTFSAPTLSSLTIQDQVYDAVQLPDTATFGRAGDPTLPARGAYILLPAHTAVSCVTVQGTSYSLGTGYELAPISQSIPTDQDPIIPTPNPAVYSSDDLFPATHMNQVGVYKLRGFSILVLALYPIQYRPATGELFAYPSLDVTITLTTEKTTSTLYRGLPQDFEAVQSRIDNPSTLATYQPQPAPKSTADLMILTTDALAASFIPLQEAHNESNVRTIIRTLTDAGGTDTEVIRDYIRDVYTSQGISWLLLGGDDNIIPDRQLYVLGMDENVTPYEDNMPVDLYYGCLDGTYNYDGDSQWGETTDGEGGGDVDLIAEVYVGRACVDNTNDVNSFVTKTIAYMNASENNDSYLEKALFAGEDLGYNTQGSWYMEQLINGSSDDGYTTVGIPASNYTIDKLYDDIYYWSGSELISRINNGVHYINHLGHANSDYDMKIDSSDVQSLTNTKYCFIISQGCMSGWFDDTDCIAEYFTSKSTHGAVAGIWNARYGFFWSESTDGDSQRLHRQFWDAVFAENKTTMGAANHDSKEDNIFIIGRSCIRWCVYETNLFGDPALDLRGQLPSPPPPPPPKPVLSIASVEGGVRVLHITIENIGKANATNISCNAQVEGGFFHGIQAMGLGKITRIDMNQTSTVDVALPIFGLGKITVTTNSTYAAAWSGSGFVLGPFILNIVKS